MPHDFFHSQEFCLVWILDGSVQPSLPRTCSDLGILPRLQRALDWSWLSFRTEVQRVEGTLKQTSLVLDHCTSYSSFLTYVLKLLALSELLLLIWIAYLLVIKRPVTRVVQFPSIEGPVSPQSSVSADTNRTSGSEVTARVTRSGPVRPSDLKKTK